MEIILHSQQPTANSQQPTANSQQPTANPKLPTINNNGTGGAIVLSDHSETFRSLSSNADFHNYIEVDGKKIRVSPDFGPNVTVKTDSWAVDIRPDHANNAYEAVYHCCGAYDSLSFGAVEGGPYKNGYFYYNGLPTQNIPTQGQANYAGHFIVSADHPAFDDEDYYRGDAAFNVDFGNKRLTGSLTHKAFQPISVSANISGNAFAGEATSSQIPAKAVVDGKFYGDNAKQLGGVFLGNEWGGAFGAAKK